MSIYEFDSKSVDFGKIIVMAINRQMTGNGEPELLFFFTNSDSAVVSFVINDLSIVNDIVLCLKANIEYLKNSQYSQYSQV